MSVSQSNQLRRPAVLGRNLTMGRTMAYPTDVDARSLIILKRTGYRFEPIDSGVLGYDGDNLELPSGRRITDDELQSFQPVTDDNRIHGCSGFDFFVIVDGG